MSRKVLAAGISRHVHQIGEKVSTERDKPSLAQQKLPFYHLLPRNHLALIRWRIYVRKRCLDDLAFRETIMEACSHDPCFFAATFAWVFEPRPPRGIPIMPFVDQADVLAWFKQCLEEERDGGLEKSRGIFGTWTVMIFAYWVWAFVPDAKIAYITKDERTMDGPDENSALGKFVYIHKKMPAWFRMNRAGGEKLREINKDHIKINTDNGSSLQGFPPTNENVRSLRFTLLINDEFAFFPRDAAKALTAAAGTTNCRLFISTFQGRDNEFYRLMRVEKSTMLRMEAYWWNNAPRWAGAYTTENGRLKLLDTTFDWKREYPQGFPFVLDGMLRSPWLDYELSKPGNVGRPEAIEEYFGLQAANLRRLFRIELPDLVDTTIRRPDRVGDIVVRAGKPVFVPSEQGKLQIWGTPEVDGGPFVAGMDIGMGMGATYSTLEAIDLTTGAQVIDYADNTMSEVELAEKVYYILLWLNGDNSDGHTFLDFEMNGKQGTAFGREIVEHLGYCNVRKRELKQKIKGTDRTEYYGTKNADKGMANFLEMERAILTGELTILSEAIKVEIAAADKNEKGEPIFQTIDGSHGDRLQGMALAWASGRDRLQLEDRPPSNPEEARSEIGFGSIHSELAPRSSNPWLNLPQQTMHG